MDFPAGFTRPRLHPIRVSHAGGRAVRAPAVVGADALGAARGDARHFTGAEAWGKALQDRLCSYKNMFCGNQAPGLQWSRPGCHPTPYHISPQSIKSKPQLQLISATGHGCSQSIFAKHKPVIFWTPFWLGLSRPLRQPGSSGGPRIQRRTPTSGAAELVLAEPCERRTGEAGRLRFTAAGSVREPAAQRAAAGACIGGGPRAWSAHSWHLRSFWQL